MQNNDLLLCFCFWYSLITLSVSTITIVCKFSKTIWMIFCSCLVDWLPASIIRNIHWVTFKNNIKEWNTSAANIYNLVLNTCLNLRNHEHKHDFCHGTAVSLDYGTVWGILWNVVLMNGCHSMKQPKEWEGCKVVNQFSEHGVALVQQKSSSWSGTNAILASCHRSQECILRCLRDVHGDEDSCDHWLASILGRLMGEIFYCTTVIMLKASVNGCYWEKLVFLGKA